MNAVTPVWRATALVVLAACAIAVHAQDASRTRPTVGLVLGGGGARGGAHLGVLEVLEELRVPVDCVSGTSMGAVVGAAFASGLTPAQMREAISKTDWIGIFDDSVGREYLTLKRRVLDERFFPGLEFGVTKEGLRYREGAVAGEKVKAMFGELVRSDLGEGTIEELHLPLSLIATDIVTGERVAMRTGHLTSAMRGSMSVPGALAPTVRDGHKLVDGGLVDNVPVQEVRDLCKADVVIAVNVGSPMLTEAQVAGALSVVAQMVNLLTEQNVARSLALLGPRDVYMRPELGDISAAAFERQLDAAAIGRETALAQAEKLRQLSVSPQAYAAWREKISRPRASQPRIVDEIRIADTRFIDSRDVRESVKQKEGAPLDKKQLDQDLLAIYSKGDLQSFDYTLLKERDKTILKLVPVEKSWGPDYLRFGLNLTADFRSESAFNVRALYRKTWLNAFGGEWLSIGQVGSEQVIATEFYQPLDYRQTWFVRPLVSYGSRKAGIYFEGDRLAEYRITEAQARLDVGVNLGNYGQASLGWIERKTEGERDTGAPVLPDATSRVGGVNARLAVDQFDVPYFPTRGYKLDVRYFDALRVRDDETKYATVEGALSGAYSIGDFVLQGTLAGGRATRGTLPPTDLFGLGGQWRLSAFAPNQILGEEFTLGTLRAEYRLTRPIPLFGLSAVAGASFERGRMKNSPTEPSLRGNIDSYSVYVGANTTFGPLFLGVADTKDRKGRIFLFLGTP
jgi:NTE family protein